MKPKWVEDKYGNVWEFPGPEGSKPLYTADQLLEAQVKVLRDAAADAEKYIDYPIDEEDITFYGHLEFMARQLRRIADELEKQ